MRLPYRALAAGRTRIEAPRHQRPQGTPHHALNAQAMQADAAEQADDGNNRP